MPRNWVSLRALRADAGWIREHTRYGELAIRWMERNKPAALLLRDTDLDDDAILAGAAYHVVRSIDEVQACEV